MNASIVSNKLKILGIFIKFIMKKVVTKTSIKRQVKQFAYSSVVSASNWINANVAINMEIMHNKFERILKLNRHFGRDCSRSMSSNWYAFRINWNNFGVFAMIIRWRSTSEWKEFWSVLVYVSQFDFLLRSNVSNGIFELFSFSCSIGGNGGKN